MKDNFGKIRMLKENPMGVIFGELNNLNDKMNAVKDQLKKANSKEAKTYEEELNLLQDSLKEMIDVLYNKDLVVNVSLDELSSKMSDVESAVKNIKPVVIPKFPDFPKDIRLPDIQINELLLAIQSIPEFPIEKLEKMFVSLSNIMKGIKIEFPKGTEFDYDRFDLKINEVIRAIKGISISVSGGGGIGSDTYKAGVNEVVSAINNLEISIPDNLATEDTLHALPASNDDAYGWYFRRMIKLLESGGVVDANTRQRVNVENQVLVLPSSYYAAANFWQVPSNVGAPQLNANVTYVQPVQTGPYDPREEAIRQARMAYAQGVRANLIFT